MTFVLAIVPPGAGADGLQRRPVAGSQHVRRSTAWPGREQQNMRCLTPADVGDLEKTFSPVSRTTNSVCEMRRARN